MQIHGLKKWVIIWLVILMGLGLNGLLLVKPSPAVYAQDDPDTPLVTLNEENIKKATVFIMQTRRHADWPCDFLRRVRNTGERRLASF